jgi:hypothetical protein|tara:strand:- start:22 stop:420 length:399 start_codon:yes stop_codon:yes gene_type:complete
MFKLQGIPATLHSDEVMIREDGSANLKNVIVWVGLDVETVQFLVNGTGVCPSDDVTNRLAEMVRKGEINIDQEYSVVAVVSVSGTVYQTVEAANEEEAAEKVHELIDSGEGLEDLIENCTVDDINIEEVEVV